MCRVIKYALRFLAVVFLPLFNSCLFENDMSYPVVPAEVLEFEVEGQKSVSIDKEQRIINVVVGEKEDIKSLLLKKLVMTPEAKCSQLSEGMKLDLSSPVEVVLTTYQDYGWTIKATQPVERYVRCEGIVGELIIDISSRRITVPVSDKVSLKDISITALKLEAEGSVITHYEEEEPDGKIKRVPMPALPYKFDCTKWRYFIVELRGQEFRWGVNLVHTDVSLSVTGVNAWAKKADVTGILEDSASAVLKYRVKGGEQWSEYSDLKVSGNSFTATISGLEPATEYEVRVECGEDASSEVSFTTETEQTLPNLGFDSWNKVGKIWYPNAADAEKIWDSANPGSGNFGFITTTPVEDIAVPGKGTNAARLESLKAVIAFAAGNIFTGSFVKIDGIGAILDWGVPFSSRPTAMKGYYKYSPKVIDNVKSPYEELKGQTDVARVMVFLTDWDEPFRVKTKESKFVDFENDPHIIAYGQLEENKAVSEYTQFDIQLEYRDTARKPRYIVVVGSPSKYGDYFTGAVGSTLWLDELELVY